MGLCNIDTKPPTTTSVYYLRPAFPLPPPGSCDCFGGIAGALAGFAALAGLVAFAIAQANMGGGRRRRSLESEGELHSLDPPEISLMLGAGDVEGKVGEVDGGRLM